VFLSAEDVISYETLQKRQYVHSILSNNTKMQFLNLTIIIFCFYYCNYGNIQSDTVDWFYFRRLDFRRLGRLSSVVVTEPYVLYTIDKITVLAKQRSASATFIWIFVKNCSYLSYK